MSRVSSFPPLALPGATALTLGSMPGVASLTAQQYYAHPRNHFWPIMARIAGFEATAPYAQRVAALTQADFAVWDVLQSCVRPGSLDSAIQAGTRVPNDFAAFFAAHLRIRRVCFNGAEAEKCFNTHVLPGLQSAATLRYARLPSTSPAHAVGLDYKLGVWRTALACQ